MGQLRVIARTALAFAIVIYAASPSTAATISVDFTVIASSSDGTSIDPSGFFANGGAGSFEYDDITLTGVGTETTQLTAFEVTIFASAPDFPHLPDLNYDLTGAVAIDPEVILQDGIAVDFKIALLGSGPETSNLALVFLPQGTLVPDEVQIRLQNEIVGLAQYEIAAAVIPEPTSALLFFAGGLLIARRTVRRC